MEHVFDTFFQADSGAERTYGGAGLGLVITKGLVELMGGTISVESTPTVGSHFSFTARFAPATATEATAPPLPVETASVTRLRGATVLVVEDNPFNQDVIVTLLERVGVGVAVAANGVQALAALREAPTTMLVLMDVQMPVMNGIEATRAIRATAAWDNTVIVGLTANVSAEDERQCREAGMSDVLAKPIAPELLYRTLERLLPTSFRPQYVDPEVLRNLTDDPVKLARFAQKFVEVLAASMTVILDATGDSDLDALAREAHSLKSSAMMVGAHGFGEQCAALERAALDGDLPVVRALVDALASAARGVSDALWLAIKPGPPAQTE